MVFRDWEKFPKKLSFSDSSETEEEYLVNFEPSFGKTLLLHEKIQNGKSHFQEMQISPISLI